jgi:TRAP-type C4-dicarboxylate transport system permease small subunit
MKTIATLNQLNRQPHLAARHLLQMCLLSACLLLAWTGVNHSAKIYPVQNQTTVNVVGEKTSYDLAHDANYRATVLLYTAQNRMHDFPF